MLHKILMFIGSQAWTYIASALLTIIAGSVGIIFVRVTATFKEAGEFLTVLGTALSDQKLDKTELNQIISEGKDVLNIWKKTPDKYKVS